jgi:hypothetical protein
VAIVGAACGSPSPAGSGSRARPSPGLAMNLLSLDPLLRVPRSREEGLSRGEWVLEYEPLLRRIDGFEVVARGGGGVLLRAVRADRATPFRLFPARRFHYATRVTTVRAW